MKKSLEAEYRKSLYAEAKAISKPAELAYFVERSMKLPHDYGSVCVALAACAVAAATVANRTENGGITGFQAGAVMWEFMQAWNGVTFPAKLVKFEDMLYPQYENKFAKTISAETWAWLQEEANKKIKESPELKNGVKEHWESVAKGNIPFGYSLAND